MRKILAGFLATSMVVSMATMVSAATVTPSVTTATVQPWTISAADATSLTGAVNGLWDAEIRVKSLDLDLQDAGGASLGKISIPVDETITTTTAAATATGTPATSIVFTDITVPAVDIAALVKDGVSFRNMRINGTYYNGKVTADGTTLTLRLENDTKIKDLAGISVSWITEEPVLTTTATATAGTTTPVKDGGMSIAVPTGFAHANLAGTTKETIETDKSGDLENIFVKDVVVSRPDGTPIPLTEKGVGADENLNDNGGVQSGKTVYFMIRDDADAAFERMGDDLYWKLKVNKANNGKYVKAISDVTKIFSKDLYDANGNGAGIVPGTGVNRHRYIKVELNEIYTDDEYKIGLDMRLSATQKAVDTNVVTKDSTEIKVKDFTFYMKNIVKDADNDWKVGIGGLMLNPVTNDWNEVTYYDEEGDVAFMKFFGDSDTGKFYAKLSTKWTHEDYAAYFNDQDAFYFEFTGSPNLSSTSRADLQIYNPFVDEDGNETIDPTTATVYQVVDGDLIDVTDSFTYGEGENGDDAFITRTRFLGSYIICEKPVEEAVGDSDIDDLMPDDLEVPEDVTPDAGNNGGGAKQPANTGRYL